MSAQAVNASVGVSAGELAVSERVRQLQAMIEQTRQAAAPAVSAPATPTTSAGGPAGFAAALQAASGTAAPTAANQGSSGPSSGEYDSLIEQAAARHGLDPAVLHGLIEQESGFDPSARSSAGAVGLTQLMPGTASSMGVANTLDPAESIEGGARYLSQLLGEFAGNTTDALAAYNAGPGAVKQYGGVPPYAETQSYVSKVLANAEAFRQSHPSTSSAAGLR
jgi:soluble lytic murein transglycosylase-like protein